MEKSVIIVAGGSGSRMNSTIPKQFLLLENLPVLMHTISAFINAGCFSITVVIPHQYIELWSQLCTQYAFTINHKVVAGGNTRFESVKNGLNSIETVEGTVAIHDGARPLVSLNLIKTAFKLAEETGSAVPCCDLSDSIRFIDGPTSKSVPRNLYKSVQTPQCFKLSLIKSAYLSTDTDDFNDDASLLEAQGVEVTLFDGEAENIKITRPIDMMIAEAIIKQRSVSSPVSSSRIP
jgi:2-C-methyl-D-erythritol 4-phosphate cytidylyltransferase